VGADDFSCRWTGFVVPRHTETYTFHVRSDDGSRLWVGGEKLVDQWRDQAPTEERGSIDLEAGRRYAVKLEYYERGGGAVCELRWSSPSTPKEVVPKERLHSGGGE
jgi:hypothetical protein